MIMRQDEIGAKRDNVLVTGGLSGSAGKHKTHRSYRLYILLDSPRDWHLAGFEYASCGSQGDEYSTIVGECDLNWPSPYRLGDGPPP